MAGDTYPSLKVAAVQASPVFLDRAATVEKACRLIEQAGDEGARVVVFPECFVAGYPHWYNYYIALDAQCRRFNVELFRNAVQIGGEETKRLGEAAKRAKAHVVIGINERPEGSYGTLYNTLLFLGPDGEVVGRHRKLVPTLGERLVFAGGDGSGMPVVETPYGGLGALICGEHCNYLAKFDLLARGEVLHAAAWPAFALDTESAVREWVELRTRSHAFEGKVWVISATGVFSEQMKDVLGLDAAARARFKGDGGAATIVNPNGRIVAGPIQGEGLVTATIDMGELVAGRIFQDQTGHYNRFDIFRLSVDRTPRGPLRAPGEDSQFQEVPISEKPAPRAS
jgi:predicted amidohydrolase